MHRGPLSLGVRVLLTALVAALVSATAPTVVDAERGPLGPEFRANTTTEGDQEGVAASDAAGNFVVVWRSRDPRLPPARRSSSDSATTPTASGWATSSA